MTSSVKKQQIFEINISVLEFFEYNYEYIVNKLEETMISGIMDSSIFGKNISKIINRFDEHIESCTVWYNAKTKKQEHVLDCMYTVVVDFITTHSPIFLHTRAIKPENIIEIPTRKYQMGDNIITDNSFVHLKNTSMIIENMWMTEKIQKGLSNIQNIKIVKKQTPYQIFIEDKFDFFKNQNPTLDNKEIKSIIREKWKVLKTEESKKKKEISKQKKILKQELKHINKEKSRLIDDKQNIKDQQILLGKFDVKYNKMEQYLNDFEIDIKKRIEDPTIDENEEIEKTCCICYEKLVDKEITMVLCGHVFHKKCLERWDKRSSQCPMCRSELFF